MASSPNNGQHTTHSEQLILNRTASRMRERATQLRDRSANLTAGALALEQTGDAARAALVTAEGRELMIQAIQLEEHARMLAR